MKVLVLNGPNLNLLGIRESELYGSTPLSAIQQSLENQVLEYNLKLEFMQSNSEAELIDIVHTSIQKVDFIIINPGGLAHTSVSLRDALLAVKIPFIEVHISNIFAREPFRHHSYLSDVAAGVICGLGVRGYNLALDYILKSVYSSRSL